MTQKPDLSIILPCHNEAAILEKNVKTIMDVLNRHRLNYEIIITEDGSTDDTENVGRTLAKKFRDVRFFHSDKRLGRGKAVAKGIKIASGAVTGFIDTDLQTPPEYIVKCYEEIKKGHDAVETIRYYREEGKFFLIRVIFSIMYRSFFKKIFKMNLEDTLAGCKFFRRDKILPVLSKVKDNHWFWDTEIMVLAHHEGLSISEIPSVFLSNRDKNRQSKASVISATIDMFFKLLALKRRIKKEYKKTEK